ncbi:MAG: type II toxin-antitoxin system RelE/ParE family toxin [Methylocystaceae bacterium]|nr:MAG: type II toxin-antitoxin system RelE/ParE family toxin [Methylocystaceae bacterium]
MGNDIVRTPRARLDLIEIWRFVADDSPAAADRLLDRIEKALAMLRDNPRAGRTRPELAPGVRSLPVGNYVLFYRLAEDVIELVRVRSGYMDIRSDDMD